MATRARVATNKNEETIRSWENAKEVRTVFSDAEVNELLKTRKWVIADAGRQHIGDGGFNCKSSYMMIRVLD